MKRFPIEGIRSVNFIVPDLAAATDFYTAVWGLEIAEGRGDTVWLRDMGSDAQILALHIGDAPAIRWMTFRAVPDSDLAALADALVAHGGTLVAALHDLDEPGGGRAVVVRDGQGRALRLVQDDTRVSPLPHDPDRPERLTHINFNSDDVARDVRLFTDALCFTLTDRSKMMAFVRTNDDHHAVVIAEAPVNTFNHVAFQLPDWESVMRASGRMVDHAFPIGWVPGRHGPGNNVFAYFVDPFGFVVQYTTDVLQVDDDYRVGSPENWSWPTGRTDQWGIAPPKSSSCKAAQLAIPFV
ncbi:VOC family protein [Sphingomonas sp. UYEF23]|uniref:VOC family protein n=1 Tax=Sphingomonas sp. UYEF23 TaxID=1756408 RepID=UPI003399ED6A